MSKLPTVDRIPYDCSTVTRPLLPQPDPQNPNDQQLASHLRTGGESSQQAIACIYSRYGARIKRFFYVRLGNDETAEDMTHDLFLGFMEKPTWDAEKYTLSSVLYRKANDLYVEELRRRDRSPYVGSDDDFPTTQAGDVEEIETSLEHKLHLKEILSQISCLRPRARDCLLLKFIDGLRVDEIAIVLGTTEAAVYKIIQRYRTTLLSSTGYDMQDRRDDAPEGTLALPRSTAE